MVLIFFLTFCLFALGHLYSNTRRTVGILDLGGGSTQITFLPKSKVILILAFLF